jgi:hypothetical protein
MQNNRHPVDPFPQCNYTTMTPTTKTLQTLLRSALRTALRTMKTTLAAVVCIHDLAGSRMHSVGLIRFSVIYYQNKDRFMERLFGHHYGSRACFIV